ncbi:MAG: hypothetical protein WC996_07520 [Peptostreptococcales bacterium]
MASIGHPVVGDTLYGIKGNEDIGRQALHARYLSFIHPMKKTRMEIVAEIPEDMLKLAQFAIQIDGDLMHRNLQIKDL